MSLASILLPDFIVTFLFCMLMLYIVAVCCSIDKIKNNSNELIFTFA